MPFLYKNRYKNNLMYQLITRLPLTNVMEIPKIEKVILNFGFIHTLQDKKQVIPALLALELLTGQKGFVTKSKKQLYSYKIRKGMVVGAASVLRNKKMDLFLEKFLTRGLAKNKNFSGFTYKMNNSSHYITLCLKDLNIFSELEMRHQAFSQLKSLNVTIVFSNSDIFTQNKDLLFIIANSLQLPCIKK